MRVRSWFFFFLFICLILFFFWSAAARSFDLAASTTRKGASCAAQVPCRTLSLSISPAVLPTLLVTLPSAAPGLVHHCHTGQEPQGQEIGLLRSFIGMLETNRRHGRL